MAGGKGCDIQVELPYREDAFWFGEGQNRVVVSVSPDMTGKFEKAMNQSGLPFVRLGKVTDDTAIVLNGSELGTETELKMQYDTTLENIMNHK